MLINKKKIIQEINKKYPFLIQNIDAAPIEEMLNIIESQSFPENADFQGFFIAYLSEKGYRFIHNLKLVDINHLRKLESLTNDILKNIDEYNVLNDLLQIDMNDFYLIFKIYFDPSAKDRILAIGHILKKNLNTRLLILDQKQQNKLIN